MTKSPFRLLVLALLVLSGFYAIGMPPTKVTAAADNKGKLTAQEIIVKHLDSIGTADVRGKITTRQAYGVCVFTGKVNTGGSSTTDGPAVFASDGEKILFATRFSSPTYPFEQLAFDGKKVTTGYIKPGLRSTLGEFLLTRSVVFKEGLLGGSLSSAWPFWDLSKVEAKFETGGTKKVNGREAYVIKYNPKKGSEFEIKIYIDVETFQHVRTSYLQIVAAPQSAGVDQMGGKRESRYEVTEDFSDFKAEEGLTLPHKYKLELFLDAGSGTSEQNWVYTFDKFTFNEKLDETIFNLKAQPQ